MIKKLPDRKGIIGIREIMKEIKSSNIKIVIFAQNCPDKLKEKIKKTGKIEIEEFDGDEQQLATALGKPFPVAMVGYE